MRTRSCRDRQAEPRAQFCAKSLREIGPGVFSATSRRDSLNSVVVAAGESLPEVLLIDPGWESDELDALARSLAERGLLPVAGLATHAYYDHLLWHPRFGDVPRWASAATTSLAIERRAELLLDRGPNYPAEVMKSFGLQRAIAGSTLPWSGREL